MRNQYDNWKQASQLVKRIVRQQVKTPLRVVLTEQSGPLVWILDHRDLRDDRSDMTVRKFLISFAAY